MTIPLIHRLFKAIHPERIPGPGAFLYNRISKSAQFRAALFWLHTFEEPFHSPLEMELLARSSPFGRGSTGFVGVLCCLSMRK